LFRTPVSVPIGQIGFVCTTDPAGGSGILPDLAEPRRQIGFV